MNETRTRSKSVASGSDLPIPSGMQRITDMSCDGMAMGASANPRRLPFYDITWLLQIY